MTHTPGPWIVRDVSDATLEKSRYANGAFQVFASDCQHHAVADCSCNHTCRDADECEANARLIAAAPDLLAALKHAALNMPHPDQMVDDAIAKAEGRQP